MDLGLIPRRYAKALFEVAQQSKDSSALYEQMLALINACEATPEVAKTLANPFVADADKASLIATAVFGPDAKTPQSFDNFLALLTANGRLAMAPAIARAYVDIYRKANDIHRVNIVSAAPMGQDERARLQEIITKHIGKGSAEFTYSVDPSLIGGFSVTVDSERLDASVRNTLKQMRLQIGK